MRVERLVTDIVIVGFILVDRMLSQLKVGCERAVAEHCAADARTECKDNFESVSGDDTQALHLGIVEQTGRLAEPA